MNEHNENIEESRIISEIRARMNQLNTLHTFSIYVFLVIVSSFAFKQFSGFLGSLPQFSISIIIVSILILTLASSIASRLLTKHVIGIIDSYDRKLNGVMRLTQNISRATGTENVFEQIQQAAMSLTQAEAGAILLVEGEELVFKAVGGPGLDDVRGMSIPSDKGLAGWVAEHGSLMYIDDVPKSPGFDSSLDWVTDYKAVTALCVPLIAGESVVGVIELLNKLDGPFDEKDSDMATFLAAHVVYNLENARLQEDHLGMEHGLANMLASAVDRVIENKKNHSQKVSRYAGLLAGKLRLSDEERNSIQTAALLHDIGCLRVSAGFGISPENVPAHVTAGYEMLAGINQYKPIAPLVLHHHENFDGSGYPEALSGADIPLGSRIIAIAEEYDNLLQNENMPDEDSLSTLKKLSGSRLDPNLLEQFMSAITKSPV